MNTATTAAKFDSRLISARGSGAFLYYITEPICVCQPPPSTTLQARLAAATCFILLDHT